MSSKEQAPESKSALTSGRPIDRSGSNWRHSSLTIGVSCEIGGLDRDREFGYYACGLCYGTPQRDFLFPDGSIAHNPPELYKDRDDVVLNPVLFIEVLSPTTQDYDRGEKFRRYRLFPTLRDYLVVHQNSIFIEHYSWNPDGSWTVREYRGADAVVPLPNVRSELHLGRAYDRLFDDLDD